MRFLFFVYLLFPITAFCQDALHYSALINADSIRSYLYYQTQLMDTTLTIQEFCFIGIGKKAIVNAPKFKLKTQIRSLLYYSPDDSLNSSLKIIISGLTNTPSIIFRIEQASKINYYF